MSCTSFSVIFEINFPNVCKFIAICNANEMNSREDPATYKMQLKAIYHEKYGPEFKFYHCFQFAKDHLKFMTLIQAGSNQPAIVDGKCKMQIGSSSSCPDGTKKANKEKQENDMAEKFVVASFTSLSSIVGTAGGSPKTGLQDAFAKFLDKAEVSIMGDAIHVINSQCRNEATIADEMMKQQILQLHVKNKAMVAIETAEIDIDKPDVSIEITTTPTNTDINDDDNV